MYQGDGETCLGNREIKNTMKRIAEDTDVEGVHARVIGELNLI